MSSRVPSVRSRWLPGRLAGILWAINALMAIFVAAAYLMLQPQPALFQPLPTLIPTPPPVPAGGHQLTAPSSLHQADSTPAEIRPVETSSSDARSYAEGPFVIGSSAGGRPLQMWRFGTGPTQRLIVAGIHGGNEINTIHLADQFIEYLYRHPEIVPADVTLYILRSLNPDGEARGVGPAGRPNDNGVDLNRNWPYRWKADWDRYGCFVAVPVTGGSHPASEPETVALLTFIESRAIDALISYHSAALGIFPGGVPDYQPSIRLAEAIAAVTTYPYPPIDTGCDYTGNLTDWAASRGIAAVDIELRNHTDTDFEENLIVLQVFLNWKR